VSKILGDNDIIVIDNLLDDFNIESIRENILSTEIPWFYNSTEGNTTVGSPIDTLDPKILEFHKTQVEEGPQLCYLVYRDGKLLGSSQLNNIRTITIPLQKKFDVVVDMTRVKYNLQFQITNGSKDKHNTPHVDSKFPHMTMIYYVNDSDGDTFFFDKKLNVTKRVSPKAGRAVIFKGDIMHTGQHPINSHARCVINMNFEVV
jgi:hypothetical protein